MDQISYVLGCEAVKHLVSATGDTECSLLGRSWVTAPGVWPPDLAPSTGYFTSVLPYPPAGTVLVMGCGAGVTAVHAALAGCTVTAVDVDPAAVDCTLRNAARHGVAGRVRGLVGDLFAPVPADTRYDLQFWNSPFVLTPDAEEERTGPGERAVFDPGYRMHGAYFRRSPAHRAPGGRIVLGFSDTLGDPDLLARRLRDAGLRAEVLAGHRFPVPPGFSGPPEVDFRLLELLPAGAG